MRAHLSVLLLLLAACSAGGGGEKTLGGGSSGTDPDGDGDGTLDDLTGSGLMGDPSASPSPNIGTEELCDGIDENDNGVIDDVDVGKDGLCDCLHIGFLGEISGESGQTTGSFGAWLNERSDVPVERIGPEETLSSDRLADLQVVVIGNLVQKTYSGGAPYYSAAEVEAFNEWIEQGGGVMALAGYTSQATAAAPANELLAPTGLSYDLETYPGSGTWTEPNTENGVSYVIRSFTEHPTTEGVSAVGVFHGYPVMGDGSEIAQDGGHSVGMAKEVGGGHVVVWADEWITNDSEWTERDDLQVARFWLNTIRWLTPANECQVPIPDVIR